ncbi:hypothetical protein [Hymenobacter sp. BT559]|uniref:Imm32 family immunity protein n=1 Tax=Hymenobacter sp. BT559 TaxID=2795729 RepID=UPI0018EA8800|nr:hypothetical protein [Hymenobacter sp. BT559]MBJ6142139.1 hypothetical protein [Hymenobacter sp. BT559]
MKYKQTKGHEIQGVLDVFVAHNEVLIHGNPEGLKSLAKLLVEIAELNQEEIDDEYLPIGAREHYLLRPGLELSASSDQVVVGRIDAKTTGAFYARYIPS